MHNKDEIVNILIIANNMLDRAKPRIKKEDDLAEEAKAIEGVQLQLNKIINNVDNKNF